MEKNGFIFQNFRNTPKTNDIGARAHRNVVMAIMGHSPGDDDLNFRFDTIDGTDLLSALDRIDGSLVNVSISVGKGGDMESINNTNN